MGRTFMAALLVLVLTACAASGPQRGSAGSPQVAQPSSSEPNLPDPTASVPPDSGEHPATGLALVQFPGGSDDPASQIFVVEADGSLRQVTGHSTAMSGASRPAWSPDRSQIAFEGPKVGSTGVKGQIGVVNADGTGERQVSEGTNPRWSRDGSRLLIEEVDDVTSEPPSMYILDIASGELTDLGQGFNPRWLADDAGISFNRAVEGEGGAFTSVLYTMSLDGGEPVELARETEAIWSPDGSAVLLVREGTISMAAPDGSDHRQLVTGYSPVWSPDGSRVLFAYDVNQDALPVLALVDLDGQELWSGVVGGSPTWSPDGTRVAVEIAYPEPMVQILDAASGEILWETDGTQPAWAS
jgi:Tol biopolymer transport system component